VHLVGLAGLDDEVVAVAKGGGAQEDNAAYADSDVEVVEAENGATYTLPTYRKSRSTTRY
jgi:hypothetical protein